MIRYLRLYVYFLRFSFSKAFEFRLDFFFRIIMDCVFYIVQFMFFHIIYLHTPILAGWNIEQMRVFICTYILIDALHMTIFANNCWWLPIYINRGDLDHYLTKPVSSLFFLSLREFAANSFLNLIIAIALVSYNINQYTGSLHLYQIIGYIALVLCGLILYWCIHMLFLISVFWTGSPRGWGDLFFSASHIMERPDRIFKGVIRFVFTFILPFTLMASFPSRFLMEDFDIAIPVTLISVTFLFFLILLFVWKRGLKVYSSASS